MYNEPDWSSLSLSELLEKSHEFTKEAYGKSLSSYSFLQRALDRTQGERVQGSDIVELINQSNQLQRFLIDLQAQTSHLIDQVKDR